MLMSLSKLIIRVTLVLYNSYIVPFDTVCGWRCAAVTYLQHWLETIFYFDTFVDIKSDQKTTQEHSEHNALLYVLLKFGNTDFNFQILVALADNIRVALNSISTLFAVRNLKLFEIR